MKEKFMETVIGHGRRFLGGPPSATVPWVGALHHGSLEVGTYLASLVCRQEDLNATNGDKKNENEIKFLQSRIATAGSVLAAAGYCCGRSSETDITVSDGNPPFVDLVLKPTLDKLEALVPRRPAGEPDGALQEILADRTAAEKELKESFALLSKEFTALSFIKRAHQEDSWSEISAL
jgi:hypothetical protein